MRASREHRGPAPAEERPSREHLEPMRHRLAHGRVREHFARYRFGADLLRGRVLDAGCGTGYGSQILAGAPEVREVLGIDRDPRVIAHARRFYTSARVRFLCEDLLSPAARNLPAFDGIACLEVLEHLEQPERLLETLHLLLAPGGRLVISTPLGRGRAVPSREAGHAFQLRRDEFERLLAPRFRARLFGQKGEGIEPWRRGGRYFLMLAACGSLLDEPRAGTGPAARIAR
jgi:2-polyprenyl-3-methyl-5-hydroxy-6-metoxy-1,4-benzoquinol methylase